MFLTWPSWEAPLYILFEIGIILSKSLSEKSWRRGRLIIKLDMEMKRSFFFNSLSVSVLRIAILDQSKDSKKIFWTEGQDHLSHHSHCRRRPLPLQLLGLSLRKKGPDRSLLGSKSLYRKADRYRRSRIKRSWITSLTFERRWRNGC